MLAFGCGADDASDEPVGETTTASPVDAAPDCVLWLHGRGDDGAETRIENGVAVVSPSGNGEWDGRRQWLYAEPADLDAARQIVVEAVDAAACERVVVHGFSNGGAFAAKLYCSGDDMDGRLLGVVIDDPVTDASADGCVAADGVDAALYWTTALEEWAPTGTSCADVGWTCEGPTVRGVEAYAAALGVPVIPSIHTDHVPYSDPPEIEAWLAAP